MAIKYKEFKNEKTTKPIQGEEILNEKVDFNYPTRVYLKYTRNNVEENTLLVFPSGLDIYEIRATIRKNFPLRNTHSMKLFQK